MREILDVETPVRRDVTDLLLAWNNGDASALDRLVPLVHRELQQLAKAHMRREREGHVLQATALVIESDAARSTRVATGR